MEDEASHYYIWDADYVSIYFLEEPNFEESNEVIKLINFFKIYQFNVYELNYFTKTVNIDINLYNYDDNFFDLAPYSIYPEYEIEGYQGENEWESFLHERKGRKNPLYWANINLYKYNYIYKDYILNQSKCESSLYGYQRTIGGDLENNGHINLNPTFKGMQGNVDYKASIVTKFLKNNRYEIISLYNDNNLNDNEKVTIIDDTDPQTLTYNLLYPYVCFYGNFYDINGNSYSNDYIKEICVKSRNRL